MSRRQKKEPEEKCAFPAGYGHGILNAIRALEDKQVALAKEAFSAEDLLDLFVHPADRQPLQYAWTLVEPAGTSQELFAQFDRPTYTLLDAPIGQRSPHVYLKFRWTFSSLQKGFYVPRLNGSSTERPTLMRQEAPPELRQKVEDVVTTLTDIHWRFSQVKTVFRRLNKEGVCRTPPAMRYVWPCIHTLCKLANLEIMAEATRLPNERHGGRVSVPRTIINELKETSDTVIRAQFLHDVEHPEPPPIRYDLLHGFSEN